MVNTVQVSRDGTISADVTQTVTSDADGIVSFRLSVPNANGFWLIIVGSLVARRKSMGQTWRRRAGIS